MSRQRPPFLPILRYGAGAADATSLALTSAHMKADLGPSGLCEPFTVPVRALGGPGSTVPGKAMGPASASTRVGALAFSAN
jgi:hypothetical protein